MAEKGSFEEQNSNANSGITEEGSFARQNADANKGVFEADSFGDQNQRANHPDSIAPDVDPVARAISKMKVAAEHASPLSPAQGAPTRDAEFDRRIKTLEDLVRGVVASLNGATIEAVCNGDGTITVTLTLPSLPG